MAKVSEHSELPPIPHSKKLTGYDWGEKTLIDHMVDQGYVYFVQYNERYAKGRESINRRDQAIAWMKDHQIDFKWVGGRSSYEFCFKDLEAATLFKIAFG